MSAIYHALTNCAAIPILVDGPTFGVINVRTPNECLDQRGYSHDGITHKALSETLKRLERNGLISRRVLPTQPIGVEYAITDLGGSLRKSSASFYNLSLATGLRWKA